MVAGRSISKKEVQVNAQLNNRDKYYVVIKPINYEGKQWSWRMAFSHDVHEKRSPSQPKEIPLTKNINWSMQIEMQGNNDPAPITIPYGDGTPIIRGTEAVKANEFKIVGHIGEYQSFIITDNQFRNSSSFKIIFTNEVALTGDTNNPSEIGAYFTKEPFYTSDVIIEVWHMVYEKVTPSLLYGKTVSGSGIQKIK